MHAALSSFAPALTGTFRTHSFTQSGIADRLGPAGVAALYRGEPAAVRCAVRGHGPLEQLIRLVLLHDAAPAAAFSELFGAATAAGLAECGALRHVDSDTLQLAIDIRPHRFGGVDHWVFSDMDAAMTEHVPGPDHVLGVGAASLSLVQATPTSPVPTLLDLGTGSGVQVLAQHGCAAHITATDVHPRALDFAAATWAGSGVPVEALCGPWFEPVAGRTFDRIVANPPFVVGLPEVGHVYRDSGLNLDGASELVVRQAPAHLNPGGTAVLLAAWVHGTEQSWQQRVASWLPDTGVAAWVIQRDIADPALYVGTWLRDESLDPRSIEAAARTEAWLDHFAQAGVTGIGFGFVAIQRLADDVPSDILCEEMPQHFTDPLGPEIEEYFRRIAWLRDRSAADIAAERYQVRPGVAVENVSVADIEEGIGFRPAALRITRTDGPRWSHEVDTHVQAIVAGLHPHGLPLNEVVELYCAAQGIDAAPVLEAAVGAVVDLLRHGVVLPASLVAVERS